MKKLKALFSGLFIALTLSLFAQNPIWCIPPNYYSSITGLHALPIGPNPYDYQGQPANNASNAMVDASGNLLFFIVDGKFFDKNGKLLDDVSSHPINNNVVANIQGTSETAIIPDPANCNRYYIIMNGRAGYTGYNTFSDKLPFVIYFDLSNSLGIYGHILSVNSIADMNYGSDPDFIQSSAPKMGGVFVAASKLRNDGSRFVFISSGWGVYRYKIDSSGFHYDDGSGSAYFPFGSPTVSIDQLELRGEMELVQLQDGTYRLAVPFKWYYSNNSITQTDNEIYLAKLNNSGQLISHQDISLGSSNWPHGLEFSPYGNVLYYTWSGVNASNNVDNGQGNLSWYDFTTHSSGSISIPSEARYSQIEINGSGQLVLVDNTHIYTYNNPNTPPTSSGQLIPILTGLNYQPNYESTSGQDPELKSYMLPDQMDGQDYHSVFSSSTECCVNNTDYDAVADTVSMTNTTWSPGLGNNPWNSVSGIISVKKDLVIGINTSLIIQNMTFRFAPGAKVVVERGSATHLGGKLTLDSTTFTADTDCNAQNMWLGVRVQGYQNNAMSGIMQIAQQGGLILKNNSVIENAYKGAVAAKVSPVGNPYTPSSFSYDYSYAGGWIQATNSSFINNVNDVEILNFYTANDLSNFTNCRFITNHALNNPTLYPIDHAKLVNVKNVRFSGCDFENTTTTVWNSGAYFQAGTGIYSVDAEYTVSARCLSGTSPCTNYDSCHFSGLQWGVSASNNLSSRTVTVDRSVFANNLTGIYLSTVDEATITRNNFHIPAVQFGETIGTILVNCTGYTVQENKLNGLGHSLNPHTYGIVIDNSGPVYNLVYKNSFSQLSVGGQSQGQNAQTNGGSAPNDTGLVWYCNTFTKPLYKADLAVTSGEISYHQGFQWHGADNQFSHSPNPAYDIWTNPGVMIFDYYYNSSNAVYAPLRINDTLTAWAYPTSIDTNTCLSLLYNGGVVTGPPVGIGGFFMQQLSARSDSLKGAIAQKRSKIDGGNSVNMFNSIGTLGRDILRADLLNASPYLSDKVLLKYIETPLVPNDYKLQVLLANSPLSDSVMQVLSNFNLPSRMMQQINAAQTGISARTRLYDVISSLKRKLAYNRNTRLRIYLNDTTNSPASMDSVIAVLQRENSEAAKKQLCDVYIGMGNSSAATALRNEIAAEYGSDDYTDLLGISLQLSQSPKGLFALKDSAGLLAQVEQIAYSSAGKAASAKAKAMLSAALDSTFLPVVEPLTGTNNQRRAGDGNNQQPKYADAGTLLIYPNPTDRNNGVVIALQSKNNAKMTAPTVKIYDVMGRLAGVYRMGGAQTRITVPTNELESGIYFVKLYFGQDYIETQKLVVK